MWWPFKTKNELTSTLSKPAQWLIEVLNNSSGSGVPVTPENALTQAKVYSCIRVLSCTIAALPFHLMQRDGQNTKKAFDHPIYGLLNQLPNSEIVAFNFFQTKYTDVFLTGTGFSEILRDGRGRPGELCPLDAMQMLLERNETTGKLTYTYGSEKRAIKPENIWRITGFSDNRHGYGIVGRSPMNMFKETIGQVIAGEQFISAMLKNGGVPKVALKVAQKLNEDQREQVRAGWEEKHKGAKKAGNIAILHNGADIKELSMSAADSQLMEFLGIKGKDICGIFGVPPHIVGIDSDVKYSNMEQQNLAFLIHGLLPWIINGEQTVYRDLLSRLERKKYYAKYNVNALLRADTKTRADFYKILLNIGVITINEIRELEELNPVAGGDNRYMQLNMGVIDELGKIIGDKNEKHKQTEQSDTEQSE